MKELKPSPLSAGELNKNPPPNLIILKTMLRIKVIIITRLMVFFIFITELYQKNTLFVKKLLLIMMIKMTNNKIKPIILVRFPLILFCDFFFGLFTNRITPKAIKATIEIAQQTIIKIAPSKKIPPGSIFNISELAENCQLPRGKKNFME